MSDIGDMAIAMAIVGVQQHKMNLAAANPPGTEGMAAREDYHDKYVFRAKSHVHGLRAGIYGHRVTEDKLIEALKLENANHPLASREAVDAVIDKEYAAALLNPEVIRKTYPDGKLPKGAVTPPDLTEQIA
jgi:hypothetical protein